MAEEYVGRKFDTEFIEGGKPPTELVEEILACGRRLDSAGLTPENAGNISVRTGNGMLVTVGGVNKGHMRSSDVVEVVGFDFVKAKVVGEREPSSEVPMHWLIYQSYPMAQAVIHAHDDIVLENAGKLKLTLGVHVTENEASYGTQDQAYEVVEALAHAQYAVIRGHGIVCMGQVLRECLELVMKIHDSLK